MPVDNQFQHRCANGLVVLGETMPWLNTAAFSLQFRAGSAYQPLGQNGLAALTCEMTERGCGEYNNRQFLEATELLGASTANHVGTYHTGYSGSCLHENFLPVLELYAKLSRAARLPVDELEAARLVCLQELYSQQDDLPQQTLRTLRERFFGPTLGRWPDGEIDELESAAWSQIRDFYWERFSPEGMILAIAGNFNWTECLEKIESLWGDWSATPPSSFAMTPGQGGYQHLQEDSQQTHIAMAAPTIPFGQEDYFLIRCAVGVLGDGMSSRLFQEVREKRGLCYSVFAGIHSLLDTACITAYSGTTAARAQETLDTIAAEFSRLQQGIHEDELRRIKVQVRTGLMAQQESCRARAGAIASDWFYLHRVRSKQEINEQLNRLSVPRVNQYLADHPIEVSSVVTVGSAQLELPHGLCQL
ncbi:MAG: pitrilysin family protein [Pirellulaceae bacterium]|nr:pitrilysin family protein [Pirellulaceae bacterium]